MAVGLVLIMPLLILIIYFSVRDTLYPGVIGWLLPTGIAFAGICLIFVGLKALNQKPTPVPGKATQ